MKFKKGEMVKILVTGEIGMVIDEFSDDPPEVCSAYERGYLVRVPDYRVVKFYEFELCKRNPELEQKLKEEYEQMFCRNNS